MTPYERGYAAGLKAAAEVCTKYFDASPKNMADLCHEEILSLPIEGEADQRGAAAEAFSPSGSQKHTAQSAPHPASQPEGMKPCPFCGSDQVGIGYTGQPAVGWVVVCLQCKARGPLSEINDDATPAIKGWGTRAEQLEGVVVPREPTEKMIEAVRKVVDEIPPYIGLTGNALNEQIWKAISAMLAAANEEHDAHR